MNYRKIEFWIVTLAVLIFISVFTLHYIEYDYNPYMREINEKPDFNFFFKHLGVVILLALSVYAAFLFLSNYVFHSLFNRKKYDLVILNTFITYTFLLIVFGFGFYVINPEGYRHVLSRLFPIVSSFFMGFLFYILLKKVIEHYVPVIRNPSPLRARLIKDTLVFAGIWLFGMIVIGTSNDSFRNVMMPFWGLFVPCGYLYFLLNIYWLLPEAEKQKKKHATYILRAVIVAFVLSVVFGVPFADGHIYLFIFFWLVQTLVVTPLAYYLYQNNKERIGQLLYLKKELGKTTADLQSLRSQINPHFLFNALNTLYGTAMQENSDRTAQGIQKLGDMMRFMLRDNMQERIMLEKEIDYLRNYIDLQMLRLSLSDNIVITTDLDDATCHHSIAPMLLIPFVENAFKHGISLNEKSWIKISLSCNEEALFFDVYNSLHRKKEYDPEKDMSGIGLENVKQRLVLLYPDTHELIIRETAVEYIVHLTVNVRRIKPEEVIPEREVTMPDTSELTENDIKL